MTATTSAADEPLDDLPVSLPESPPELDSQMTEPGNISPITAPENMEVHHHPDLHHKPKKWKEYFLEFIMIFLAVTMGFFAESYREKLGEQSKEKEYILSLVEDLKSDQQVLSQHIAQVKNGISMMDSMINLLNNPSMIAANSGQLYYLARLSPRLWPLLTTNRTFEQLKNSGNFRLIRNIGISNMIMTYYEKFPLISLLQSINETEFTDYKKVAAKIFDPAIFVKMEGPNNEVLRMSNNPPLRTMDKELFQELAVFTVYLHGTKKGVLAADEEIKAKGAELITYLQKAYHLE